MLDQLQLALHLLAGTVSQICCRSAIALLKSLARAFPQERHHGLAVRHRIFRKFVSEIFQRELEAGRKLRCVGEGVWKISKQLLHFFRRLQMLLTDALQHASCSRSSAVSANG